MAVYKDNDRNTWYCKFYYTNWQGEKKQKLKRGFKLQREAKDYERKFLEQFAKNPDITFDTLYDKYRTYITPRIKESTAYNRFKMLDTHVLPYFRNRIVSDITPEDIIQWQNHMLSKQLSNTYMHNANVYIKAIFAYAVDYLGLPKNPCRKTIGSSKTKKIDFWTPEEYAVFIDACRNNIEYFTMFEILYYTGMRVGELLALTLGDIDFRFNQININKGYYYINGRGVISTPKTEKSNRTVDIPNFLTEEIYEYSRHLYKPDPDSRLFIKSNQGIRDAFNSRIERAGVKKIRVHDLRHSHASLLINLGANPVLVAERLGHESADITLKIYAHLFPTSQADIVRKIMKAKY